MIEYFVSYVAKGPDGQVFGRCCVTTPEPIRTIGHIAGLESGLVQQFGLEGVVILNFQRFEAS